MNFKGSILVDIKVKGKEISNAVLHPCEIFFLRCANVKMRNVEARIILKLKEH